MMSETFLLILVALAAITLSTAFNCPCKPLRRKTAHTHNDISMAIYKNNGYVSPLMEERMKDGMITPRDLDRMFTPNDGDFEYIERKGVKGFAGVVFGLDSCLVDISAVVGYSYAAFASDLGQPVPDPAVVRDILGSSLREGILALGWAIPMENVPALRKRFYEIMDRFMDAIPVAPREGAIKLLDEVITDGNKVAILTALPRSLAVKAMKKAGISQVLQGRIDPDNLVYPLNLPEFINPPLAVAEAAAEAARAQAAGKLSSSDFGVTGPGAGAGPGLGSGPGEQHHNHGNTANHNVEVARTHWDAKFHNHNHHNHHDGGHNGDDDQLHGGMRYEGAILIRSCGMMRRPPVFSILVDASRRNVVNAKRMGLSVLALQGNAQASMALRAADRVVTSLSQLKTDDIYNIVRKNAKQAQGPVAQTQAMAAPVRTQLKSVSAAADTVDRPQKDTFADEFGSDTL